MKNYFKSIGLVFSLITLVVSVKPSHVFGTHSQKDFFSDTINSKYFSHIVRNDSIKILNFNKSCDTSKLYTESIAYIDYRKNVLFKQETRKMNIDSLIRKSDIFLYNIEVRPVISISKSYPKLLGLYIPVYKYKNEFCFYDYDTDYFRCFTDSMLVIRYMTGMYGYYYKNIKHINDIIEIELFNNNENYSKAEIKFLNDKYNAIILRLSRKTDEGIMFDYDLLVPSSKVANIPILNTLFSLGLDGSFDDFDKIPFDKIFNE